MSACAASKSPPPPEPAARACVLEFENALSTDYVLKGALFTVDRVTTPIYRRLGDADLAARAPVCAYDGPWPPGAHSVELTLVYRGRDPSRAADDRYRLFVRSRHTFEVPDAGAAQPALVVAYEKGGPELAPDERPAIRWQDTLDPGAPLGGPSTAAAITGAIADAGLDAL